MGTQWSPRGYCNEEVETSGTTLQTPKGILPDLMQIYILPKIYDTWISHCLHIKHQVLQLETWCAPCIRCHCLLHCSSCLHLCDIEKVVRAIFHILFIAYSTHSITNLFYHVWASLVKWWNWCPFGHPIINVNIKEMNVSSPTVIISNNIGKMMMEYWSAVTKIRFPSPTSEIGAFLIFWHLRKLCHLVKIRCHQQCVFLDIRYNIRYSTMCYWYYKPYWWQ
jgi:hypothetical protein